MNFLMSYNMKIIIIIQKPFNDDSYNIYIYIYILRLMSPIIFKGITKNEENKTAYLT